MELSRAKLKSFRDRASRSFRPFWIGYASNKCFRMRTLP
jgi:hypothetical protein